MFRLSSFTPRTTRPLRCMRTSHWLYPPVNRLTFIPRGCKGQYWARTLTTESRPSNSESKWRALILLGTVAAGGLVAASLSSTMYFPLQAASLDEKQFMPFILESKEAISSTNSIFSLVPPHSSGAPLLKLHWEEQYRQLFCQGVWSVEAKQPQLQIARAYTPLPPLHANKDDPNSHALRFLIRHDPKGEVSSYLHKLPLGAEIELRGPRIEYKLPEGADEVVLFAGGTGIAPALQVAYALYDLRAHAPWQPPRIRILWANRRREDCFGEPGVPAGPFAWLGSLFTPGDSPRSDKARTNSEASPLVQHLQYLEAKHPGRFSVDFFVDEEKTFINEQAVKDSLQFTQRKDDESPSRRKLILISGPEGFVNYLAGPKRWVGGRQVQGELGGLMSRIDHSGWEVWKL